MTEEEAKRILEALKEENKDLENKKKSKKTGRIRVVKDW